MNAQIHFVASFVSLPGPATAVCESGGSRGGGGGGMMGRLLLYELPAVVLVRVNAAGGQWRLEVGGAVDTPATL